MWHYIARRLILLPITLFCIVLVNFLIINLAPNDPITVKPIGDQGATRSTNQDLSFKGEEPYTVFREHYGLTLPILFNTWPELTLKSVKEQVTELAKLASDPTSSVKEYNNLRITLGDEARYIMPYLLQIAEDSNTSDKERIVAVKAFIRGGTQWAYLGSSLSYEEKQWNRKIAKENNLLRSLTLSDNDPNKDKKLTELKSWYEAHKEILRFEPTFWEKVEIFFVETRFCRYLSRVATLDFGTLRNNDQKSVIEEVIKRMKYSLTLSVIPLVITFFLCQLFGLLMAIYQNKPLDLSLNFLFLISYAIPVFVVAPFMIEKIALHHNIPFTDIPIPISGFTSPSDAYNAMTSLERVQDISLHLALPLITLLYGALAVQSRIARTAVLEVLRMDYVRTARAKGLKPMKIYIKHVGRNASITMVTSIAGSLGVILGGSLIVETLFQINGFGKFFYEAIVNRDYNVMMFSALAGSFLALVGYLVADICYTLLDPRVSFD